MATEKRFIDANALIKHLDLCIDQSKGLLKSVCVAIKCFVEQMSTVDAVEVVHSPMRVEVTTEDFSNLEWAKENGCYRKHYFCPSCDIEIGHKTFDKERQFGQGTVLHSNKFPNYCPNCGAKMDGDGNA